jgi:pimeloyl-ACP methyl ester carboxylesterase
MVRPGRHFLCTPLDHRAAWVTLRCVSESQRSIAPPSLRLLALEGRVWLEFATLLPALPLLELTPRGDGHSVLVLPGWLASDRSTQALRWFLRRRGYDVHGWEQGRNLGPTPDAVAALGRRFTALRKRSRRRVSVIGWSLGGIYARELARHFPNDVRQVITLASPFREPAATRATALFRRLHGRGGDEHGARLAAPLPVAATSLYSRTDGIVAWQSCLDDDGPLRQNVEVVSSHIGMGHHPAALHVIADRLAQPEDTWRPYVPRGWAAWTVRTDGAAAA